MADHSKPVTTDTYALYTQYIDERFDDLTRWLDPGTTTPTNLPTDAKRWSSPDQQWQKWSGTAWSELSTLYKFNSVALTGGTANGIPYLDGSKILTTGAALAFTGTQLSVPAGTAAAPAITTIGDLNTGVYFPAAEEVAISATGAQIAKWSAAGMTLPGGTANGIAYLNASKVLTTGAALAFNGTNLTTTGGVGIGGGSSVTTNLYLSGTVATGITQIGVYSNLTGGADGTSVLIGFYALLRTAVTAYTVSEVAGFRADNPVKGAGSTITAAVGLRVGDITSGVTNIGVRTDISAGTNKWNIYAVGTANSHFGGAVGIGSTWLTARGLVVGNALTGSATAIDIHAISTVNSDVTLAAYAFRSDLTTQAAAFTLTSLVHFAVVPPAFGAGSAVTTQVGFDATSAITGATNNYGFRGQIAAGTGRYNLYMDGTAANYLAGQLQLAAGAVGIPALAAVGDLDTGLWFPAANTIALSAGGIEYARLASTGTTTLGGTSTAPAFKVNPTASQVNWPAATGATTGQPALLSAEGETNVGLRLAGKGTGPIYLRTNGSDRFQVGDAGQLGIAGANYGTAGQVMVSGGASASPSWSSLAATETSSGLVELATTAEAVAGTDTTRAVTSAGVKAAIDFALPAGEAPTAKNLSTRTAGTTYFKFPGFSFASDDFVTSGNWNEAANSLIMVSGTYRVSFDVVFVPGNPSNSARVYKNGATFGTLRTFNNSTPTTITEDLAFVAGDTIQIFVNDNLSSAPVRVGGFKVGAVETSVAPLSKLALGERP